MNRAERKQRRRERAKAPAERPETRTAEAATVAWMVSMVTCLACQVAAALARWFLPRGPEAPQTELLIGLLEASAVVIGLVSLGLAALAYKLRATRAPRGITVFSVLVAIAPLATVLARAMR